MNFEIELDIYYLFKLFDDGSQGVEMDEGDIPLPDLTERYNGDQSRKMNFLVAAVCLLVPYYARRPD